ncbi:centromere protein H isoform X1 [Saimiri boliviensis]|uniref:centromere protein H isoform X1 n=1 Tax=Saimiri boliviensis TaxID=27679 RepID=UPI003D777ADA
MEEQPQKQAADQPADSGGEGGAGGPSQVAGDQAARSEDRMTLLLRLRAQTKQQLLEYKSMLDASEEKTPEQIMQEKQIEVKIEDLEKEIEEAKIAFEIKQLAIDRLEYNGVILAYCNLCLLDSSDSPCLSLLSSWDYRIRLSTALKKNLEKISTESSVLMDNMKHLLKLNKLVMKLQQESWDLEEKLLDTRKKRLQLKQASESKLLEIQSEKNKQKIDLNCMENSESIKIIRQNLQMEIKITTVIQHVFQNLILGSKVNWAEDSALKEIVLQLEKNVDMM